MHVGESLEAHTLTLVWHPRPTNRAKPSAEQQHIHCRLHRVVKANDSAPVHSHSEGIRLVPST
jgi:hypothetical protein